MGGMRIIEYIEFRSLAVPEEFGAGAVLVVGLSWPYKHAGHSRSCSRAAAASSGSGPTTLCCIAVNHRVTILYSYYSGSGLVSP